MARLDTKTLLPEAFYKRISTEFGYIEKWEAEDKALADLEDVWNKQTSDKGLIMRFQVNDGYALYRVTSLKPLLLQHIPSGDAYTISPAMVRGIGIAEVKAEAASARSRYNYWKKRNAEKNNA